MSDTYSSPSIFLDLEVIAPIGLYGIRLQGNRLEKQVAKTHIC